jgi:hypothetical protein
MIQIISQRSNNIKKLNKRCKSMNRIKSKMFLKTNTKSLNSRALKANLNIMRNPLRTISHNLSLQNIMRVKRINICQRRITSLNMKKANSQALKVSLNTMKIPISSPNTNKRKEVIILLGVPSDKLILWNLIVKMITCLNSTSKNKSHIMKMKKVNKLRALTNRKQIMRKHNLRIISRSMKRVNTLRVLTNRNKSHISKRKVNTLRFLMNKSKNITSQKLRCMSLNTMKSPSRTTSQNMSKKVSTLRALMNKSKNICKSIRDNLVQDISLNTKKATLNRNNSNKRRRNMPQSNMSSNLKMSFMKEQMVLVFGMDLRVRSRILISNQRIMVRK